MRPRNLQDNATPSGNAMMVKQLIRLAAYTGDSHYNDTAYRALGPLGDAVRQFPQAFAETLNAIDMLVAGLAEVAIAGNPVQAETQALLEVVQGPYRPNIITALTREDVDGEAEIPLLSYRTKRDGLPTVYVCRHFACANPVTTPEDAARLLDESQ